MALCRSYLFAPGNNERLLAKVFTAGADAVVLDLEDAVPEAEKERARGLVGALGAARRPGDGPALFVRINALDSPHWRGDLEAVVAPALAGVRIPKAEFAEDVLRADATLLRLERERGLEPGGVELSLTVETARGVEAAGELARACARVRSLGFGAADFCRDLLAESGPDEIETLYARSRLVIASRAAGLDPPVASVYTSLDDEDGLRRTSHAARRLGFFGRSCIHPRQVGIVNDVFTPRPEEVARARRVLLALEAARRGGAGATTTGEGEFVDEAVARRARRVLEIAGALAGREAGGD